MKCQDSSLRDRVGQMNIAGLDIANMLDKNPNFLLHLTEKDINIIYGVADGLAEEFVMRRIEGRTSITQMQKPVEELDAYVSMHINKLCNIKTKLCKFANKI